ncbi:hypothetical protein ScPMuIL_002790 [Solemya velum]
MLHEQINLQSFDIVEGKHKMYNATETYWCSAAKKGTSTSLISLFTSAILFDFSTRKLGHSNSGEVTRDCQRKEGRVLRVDNCPELETLSELLLSRPLFLRVTLVHTEVASKYSVDSISIWEGDFAVLVNTSHPSIRLQMSKALKKATYYMAKGQRFCIELDISEAIESWYIENQGAYPGCDDFHSAKSKNSRIYITNYTTFNHCFDCSPKWWLFFSPCWMMSAPCYFSFRRLTCKDLRVNLKADVTSIRSILATEKTSIVSVQCGNYEVPAPSEANESLKKTITNSSSDSDNAIAINSVHESLSYGSLLTST